MEIGLFILVMLLLLVLHGLFELLDLVKEWFDDLVYWIQERLMKRKIEKKRRKINK